MADAPLSDLEFLSGERSASMLAAAKDVDGKLESALGELTGDTSHQIKGKAKQVQTSAMNAAEELKDSARSMAQKVSDAAAKLADGKG